MSRTVAPIIGESPTGELSEFYHRLLSARPARRGAPPKSQAKRRKQRRRLSARAGGHRQPNLKRHLIRQGRY